MPTLLIVDGVKLPYNITLTSHEVQAALCKLFQVLQFVFSGKVGDHGRKARL